MSCNFLFNLGLDWEFLHRVLSWLKFTNFSCQTFCSERKSMRPFLANKRRGKGMKDISALGLLLFCYFSNLLTFTSIIPVDSSCFCLVRAISHFITFCKWCLKCTILLCLFHYSLIHFLPQKSIMPSLFVLSK